MKHFFISYTSADREWAEWIAWQLESAGYSVVIQAWDFRPGSNFVLEMQRGASEAERTLAVLSPDFLAARFTQPEWAAAFAQDPTGEYGTLVPVRVRECDARGLLPQIIFIDLVGVDENAAKQKLLAGVQRGRAKPISSPQFPSVPSVPSKPFPGTLPAICNIPFHRNPNFTGREKELSALADALKQNAVAIHGLGGVGKTQLAVEYAYRHTREYDIVWFVRAESAGVLAGDLAQLATRLQLPERDERDQNIVIQAVKRELAQRDRWVIFFDNAEEPRDLRAYLPQGGHIIITSRNPNWGALAHPLDVQVLPRGQAIEFLLKRIGLPPLSETGEGRGGGELADALGCLPLALEQAGAYIEANGKTIAEYLKLYHAHERKLLEQMPATDYPRSVATTWEISFDAIAKQSPASVALLNLLAFFAPDAIPRDLLQTQRVCETLRVSWDDELQFDAAVLPLRRHSLVRVGDGLFAVHRLVQTIVRDRMTDDARKEFASIAAQMVNDAFPDDVTTNVESWNVCARLLAHARATADYATTLGVAPEASSYLFNQAGLYLQNRADFTEAKEFFERAIRVYEATFGDRHQHVATAVNNLGTVLQVLSDLDGAKKYFERALAIDEAAFGKDHPNVARDVNNLGGVLQDLGDLDGAKKCFERALAIGETTLGKDHPNVATGVNNLGGVLQDLGDLDGAKKCFERALAIDQAAFGKDHPEVATDVNNLGLVLRVLGDLDGAKKCYARALKIFIQFLPENHPNIKIVRGNLEYVEELQRTKTD